MLCDDAEYSSKIYFQVLINYTERKTEDSKLLESKPVSTLPEASNIAVTTAEGIASRIPGSNIVELNPEESEDEYHILVVEDEFIVAKLGVITHDYSRAVIH